MNCPQCGRICPLEANFCARCGAKLEHDNVTFDEHPMPQETPPAPVEQPASEKAQPATRAAENDVRPLAANPVRPARGESPFVAPKGEKPAHQQRLPIFQDYVPAEEEPPEEEPLSEPTAIYSRPAAIHQARAAMQRPDPEPEDEFGWDEEPPKKARQNAPRDAQHGKTQRSAEDTQLYRRPAPVDFHEAGENEDEEQLRSEMPTDMPAEMPRRKPMPNQSKPVSHIRPVSQDRPIDDPVFLFDDEEEEEETTHRSGIALKILAALTAVVLLLCGLLFFKSTETGRRIQAMLKFSKEPTDYILLGNYYMNNNNYSSAAEAYYLAFVLNQEDYNLGLKVAEGLTVATDYDRAVRLYKYWIAKSSDDPQAQAQVVRRLGQLYQELGQTAQYDQLMAEYSGVLAQDEAQSAPSMPDPGETEASGTLLPPEVNVPEGVYTYTLQLALTSVQGAEIYYTLDGTMPGSGSNRYNGFINLEESKTYELRAVAVSDNKISPELRVTYQVCLD